MGAITYSADDSYGNEILRCGIRDSLLIFTESTSDHVQFLWKSSMLPSVECLAMNSSATVSGSTFETAGQNGNIILDPDVSRVPYIDSNFTLFILSSTNDNSLVLAASTVFLGSQTGNRTLLAPTADDFLTLLKDNVETFGYNGSTPFLGSIYPQLLNVYEVTALFFPNVFHNFTSYWENVHQL